MTTDDAHRYLIAYDMPDDRRRTRLANRLLSYGDRLQFSVFIADCKPARLVRLKLAVGQIIVPSDDSVLICDLGPVRSIDSSRFSFVGRSRPITPLDVIVV